jgi:hypothetical protein
MKTKERGREREYKQRKIERQAWCQGQLLINLYFLSKHYQVFP